MPIKPTVRSARQVRRNPQTGRFEDAEGRPLPPPVVVHGPDGHVLSADEIEHVDHKERGRRLGVLLDSWVGDLTETDDERESWKEIKQALDSHRLSDRKLFP